MPRPPEWASRVPATAPSSSPCLCEAVRSGGAGLGVATMSPEYAVEVRGPLPSDLSERISRAHAEALASLPLRAVAPAGGDGAQTEAGSIAPKASAPADMLPEVGAGDSLDPPGPCPP